MIICLFADLSNSVSLSNAPMEQRVLVLSSVGGQLDCGRPLRYMMHLQLQEKMCCKPQSNNAQLSLRITSQSEVATHMTCISVSELFILSL